MSNDGKIILYDISEQNNHAIYISVTSIITDGIGLSNYELFLDTKYIPDICSADCKEENVLDDYPYDIAISLSECKFDVKGMIGPRYLGEVVGCYKLYKNMVKKGMKIIAFDLKKIDTLQIGTANEHILFEYICRIKKYNTLIFVIDLADAISKVGEGMLENVKLCQNKFTEYYHREQKNTLNFGYTASYLTSNSHYLNMRFTRDIPIFAPAHYTLFEQVKSHCIVSPHEVIYALNCNESSDETKNYKWNSHIMNCFVYGYVDCNAYGNSDGKMTEIYETYIDKHFNNFTNDTSYNNNTPRYESSLYVIADDGPGIEDFTKCLTKGKQNFTIIILCDEDKETQNVLRVDKHGIPQMIIYRNKNKKLILP